MDALGGVVQAMMGGLKVGEYHEGGHQNDIYMRVPVEERLTASDLEKLHVRNNRGELVRLSEVADLKTTLSLQSITRYNRQRSVNIYANPAPGTTQQIALAEALKIAKEVLPPGYTGEATGSSATNQQSIAQLGITMLLGIVVAYMVLGSQFNSFIHPITILLALPFSITGALMGLLAGDKLFGIQSSSLNLYSFIGIILLMGLVKKNSIMLVDFTNQMRARGMDLRQALLTACPVRLRPILMTSLATIAGAVPAALALGPGAELRQPMAIAIIGGIIISTLLTLVVVPCAYSLMARLEREVPHSFGADEEGNLTTNIPLKAKN
jgi:HAE1 family hydrophobic/amphiphilic exporter-1